MRKCSLNAGMAILLGLLLGACGARNKEFIDEDEDALDAGEVPDADIVPPINGLFGIVFPKTGLGEAQCKPEQTQLFIDEATGGEDGLRYFTGLYTKAQIDRLRSMVLVEASSHLRNPLPFLPSSLDDSPWNHLEHYATPPAGTVCGLKIVDDADPDALRYALDTYESKAAAEMDGARVTHLGNCGHCSSMADLAVLLSLPDRTSRMRRCALKGLTAEGKVGVLNCVEEIGLSEGCTMAWYYNSIQTQKDCIGACLQYAEANYHNVDGALNDCMICNAEKIDEVFKVFAGRRDDAQPISMCRELPEDEWICHNYADDFGDPDGCIGIGAPKQKWVCTTDDYDKAQENYDLDKCVQLME